MRANEDLVVSGLKLLAEDAEGLAIVAAAVQDALVKPESIRFDGRSKTFGIEINRFQWERAGKRMPFFRSRAVLAFAGVLGVRSRAVSKDIDAVHALMDVTFVAGGGTARRRGDADLRRADADRTDGRMPRRDAG